MFKLQGLASLVFLTAWVAPQHTKSVDFRSTLQPLRITIDKSSPVYAALESIRDIHPVARNVASDIGATGKFAQVETKFKSPAVQLQGLVISRETKIDHLSQLIAATTQPEKKYIRRFEEPTDLADSGHHMPRAQMAELLAAAPENQAAPISVNQYAEVLVKEELRRRESEPKNIRTLSTKEGTPIYVSRGPLPTAKPIAIRQLASMPVASKVTAPVETVATVTKTDVSPTRTLSAQHGEPQRYKISGLLTMTAGAGAVIGQHQISVFQFVDGLKVSAGIVNLTSGDYELGVDRLEGQIVAEIRTRAGDLIGMGQSNLYSLKEKSLNQARIRDVNLLVTPVFNGTHGEVVSSSALGSQKFLISDAQLEVAGLDRRVIYQKDKKAYEDGYLVMPSNYLLRAQRDDYWPSIALAESGEPFQVQLLPNKLVDSFLSLTLKKYDARDSKDLGLIWGKVSMLGKPVEGASLQIVGENEHTPTYFSGYIPDQNRTMTSPSGEFAFSGLESIEKAVRVTLGAKSFWPVLIPVENKTVSYADLQIEAARTVDFKSYEAFGGKPKSARVVPLGTNEELYIPEQGSNRITVETIKGLTLLEAETDAEHMPTRAALKSGQIEVNLPFVKRDWLRKMRLHLNLKKGANSTAAIFYVAGDEFDVTIGSGQATELNNIAYFNAEGMYSDHATGDGGFVVFDLPRGFSTATIVPEHTKRVITQTVYVDEYAAAATTVNLGY